jgi:hypothetical protein
MTSTRQPETAEPPSVAHLFGGVIDDAPSLINPTVAEPDEERPDPLGIDEWQSLFARRLASRPADAA